MGFPFKVLDRTKQFDEDFLNNIKGLFPMPHHAVGDSIDLLMIFIEDLLQCLLISLLTSGDHLGFFMIHYLLPCLTKNVLKYSNIEIIIIIA